jgi:hypothetical protein
MFADRQQLLAVTESLQKSKILQDLEKNDMDLQSMEESLEGQISTVLKEAALRKGKGDLAGAKKKLIERRGLQQRLERLRGSQAVINMHLETLRGAELNKSLISTLRASSDAMRRLAPDKDMRDIEDVMFDLEGEMKKAREMNDVLAKPLDSEDMDFHTDTELQQEMDELLMDGEEKVGTSGNTVKLELTGGREGTTGRHQRSASISLGGAREGGPAKHKRSPSISVSHADSENREHDLVNMAV